MRWLQAPDLEDIAAGAALLGTGGGGDPYIGKLLARGAIEAHGAVRLISLDELADDAQVITCASSASSSSEISLTAPCASIAPRASSLPI